MKIGSSLREVPKPPPYVRGGVDSPLTVSGRSRSRNERVCQREDRLYTGRGSGERQRPTGQAAERMRGEGVPFWIQARFGYGNDREEKKKDAGISLPVTGKRDDHNKTGRRREIWKKKRKGVRLWVSDPAAGKGESDCWYIEGESAGCEEGRKWGGQDEQSESDFVRLRKTKKKRRGNVRLLSTGRTGGRERGVWPRTQKNECNYD